MMSTIEKVACMCDNVVNVSVFVIAQVLRVLYTNYSNVSIEILFGTRRFFPHNVLRWMRGSYVYMSVY